MDDSIQEPERDCEPAESANPGTTVTGDAGCEDENMTINADEVIEECLSNGNYVAEPPIDSGANHDQYSTSGSNIIPVETSVEMEGPSSEVLSKQSVLEHSNDQPSTSSGNLIDINNTSNIHKTSFDNEGSTKKIVEPDGLQSDLDQSPIMSGIKTCDNPVPNSHDQTLFKQSIRLIHEDLLKQVLVKNTMACKPTQPLPALKKVEIFTQETGRSWHDVRNSFVTPRLITKNLPEAFSSLPILGRPTGRETLEEFQDKQLREFVGYDLNDEEYRKLSNYCSPDKAMTGNELVMSTTLPRLIAQPCDIDTNEIYCTEHADSDLCIVKKHEMREERELVSKKFKQRLKYRGIRMMPLASQLRMESDLPIPPEDQLEPGKDMLFHIRFYRPYYYNFNQRNTPVAQLKPSRHSVFSRDSLITGRTTLQALRDTMICPNDIERRHDVSTALGSYIAASTTARDLFPSGFMFINNVFYVDDRPGCRDMSAVIREWAVKRKMGKFDKRSMNIEMKDVPIRLCHPEVYVHQGDCEHVFTISEVRLMKASDPLNLYSYPCYTSASQEQCVYCSTCADYSAKWIVVGSNRIPFDPAFFCDTCIRLYLYKDNTPLEGFQVYGYRSHESEIIKYI